MSRVFEKTICALSEESGYSYDFLVDKYMEMLFDGDVDWEQFVGITLERDWTEW